MNDEFYPDKIDVRFGTSRREPLTLGIKSLQVSEAVNQISSAVIVLSSEFIFGDMGNIESDFALTQTGESVSVIIDNMPFFSGKIVGQTFHLGEGVWTVTLNARHDAIALTALHQTDVYYNQTEETIIRSLLSKCRIYPRGCEELNLRHEQLVQFDCSCWVFIQHLLRHAGVFLLTARDGSVSIKKLRLVGVPVILDMKPSETGTPKMLRDAAVRFTNLFSHNKYEAACWDVSSQRLSKTCSSSRVEAGSGGLDPQAIPEQSSGSWRRTFSQELSSQQLTADLDSRLTSDLMNRVQGEFLLENRRIDFSPGDTLELKGFSRHLNGKTLITRIEHTLRPGSWESRIFTGLPLHTTPDEWTPSMSGLHMGVVTKDSGDTSPLDRLEVRFPVLDNKTLWCRCASPYASNNRGLCFSPDVGDEVVVTFIDEDPSNPVIIGSTHNPKNKSPINSTNRKDKGVYMNYSGYPQHLVFSPKKSLQMINDKQNLTLDHAVNLSSQEQIALDARSIKVTAKSDVTVTGKQKVELKSRNIDLG